MQTGNLKALDSEAVSPSPVIQALENDLNQDMVSAAETDELPSNISPAILPAISPAARSEVDIYQVDLGFFSGPMDLLLHLVSLKEVPIEDVSMAEVLEQYLAVVNAQAQELDLEKASEYLVIAATLMVIKSRALLPAEIEDNTSEETADEQYLQFFEDLRARLKAFELTRSRAQALIETPQLGLDTFIRTDKSALQVPPEMVAEGESINRIGGLFYALVKRVGGIGKSIRISIEPVSVVSSMMKIVDALKIFTKGVGSDLPSTFSSILRNAYKKEEGLSLGSRNVVLGSFIALLELAKRGMVSLKQDYGSEEIYMTLRMRDVDSENQDMSQDTFTSEFDEPAAGSEENMEINSSSVLVLDDYRGELDVHELGNKSFENELNRAQRESDLEEAAMKIDEMKRVGE